MKNNFDFKKGIKDGLPIGFAYLAVAFSFGLISVKSGLSVWLATLISATNITSAGQFAGVSLLAVTASFAEIAFAVFIINSRYMLMSVSLSQQLDNKTGIIKRLIMSFFVTDEIFALASSKRERLNFSYFCGLAFTPYFGWTIGTYLGGRINSMLPLTLQNAMGIALYCMFIAIIIPPARTSKPILFCIATSILLSCAFYYLSFLSFVSYGVKIIVCSVSSAALTAVLFPVNNNGYDKEKDIKSQSEEKSETKSDKGAENEI